MIGLSFIFEKISSKNKKSVEQVIQQARSQADANKESTHRSNVNEFLLAQHLAKAAGLKDTRPGETEEEKATAQSRHNASKEKISPEEYEHQSQRAKHMAQASILEYKKRGIDLTKAKSVHLSAGKGAIKKITGLNVESKDNTSDVMLKVPHKTHGTIYPGISAKSNMENTEGKGAERISNPGLTPIAKSLGEKWHEDEYPKLDDFAERKGISHLPLSSKKENTEGRKQWLRKPGNEQHLDHAKEEGNKILNGVRESYFNRLNKLSTEEIKNHLASNHFRTNESKEEDKTNERTPYIVASGYGTKKGEYGAHAHGMETDSSAHVDALSRAHHFTLEKSGENGIRVYAHKDENDTTGNHLITIASKFNSQPMASSINFVGTEGTLKPKKIKKSQ
jgi:hypothetical protein